MELPELDQDEQVTDFRQHFSSDMLVSSGVNFSALLDHDLRCGGRVLATNLTYNKLKELAADCMLQKCIFRYTVFSDIIVYYKLLYKYICIQYPLI